ncbi:sensor histidine kinase [Faecalispora anaeroviscerum]|uniref:sensor histidine kinase n=1 Tax=Faecalispora anaeroviscerum TaxID=2991836 RepID=UPI0024BBBCAC|nr:HAMP domain-containing sensor histidine kinase [Faecalispora anaeroviscerum]
MKIWGITRRWILNSLGIILLILSALILCLSLVVQGYVYNGIQQTVNGRSGELTNVFADYDNKTAVEFSAAARTYVENSPSKQMMEMMVLSASGRILVTSTGFPPDQTQTMPDVQLAQGNKDGYGTWQGRLSSGEKVMAVTRVIRNQGGSALGSIRYIVSLEEADRQIFTIVGGLLVMGFLVILFVVFSSTYFIKSIVDPIKLISATAKRIAQGDFNARIQNRQNDEIGELCDTINKMAVELGTAEKMKNDFISSVSHELRTPLTAIKGWAETMQGMDDTERETYEKGMGVIIRESERLSGIVEELLDFSRMQNGRMTLMMDKIDILAELGEAVYMFTDRAQAEGKFLVYEEPALLSPVLGDINRLRQVFVNIIDNALKYTKEGDTVTVTAEEANGQIRVVISDTGCGISAKDLPNVKKKFYKANQTVRGSGIGLALADEIMRLHDGRLELESQEGVGTVVTITIPTLRQSAPEAKPAPATEERNPEQNV